MPEIHSITPEIEETITSADIDAWLKRKCKTGWRRFYEKWPPDLFRKSYSEIVRFLIDRRESTTDLNEYYDTLGYLIGHVEYNLICTPFHLFRPGDIHTSGPEKRTSKGIVKWGKSHLNTQNGQEKNQGGIEIW